MTVDEVQQLTHIDPWFLERISGIVRLAGELEGRDRGPLARSCCAQAKRAGFSDAQIAALAGTTTDAVREQRREHGIRPFVKQIDTLAAEYPARDELPVPHLPRRRGRRRVRAGASR